MQNRRPPTQLINYYSFARLFFIQKFIRLYQGKIVRQDFIQYSGKAIYLSPTLKPYNILNSTFQKEFIPQRTFE